MRWTLKHSVLLLLTFLFSVATVGEDVLHIDFGEGWELAHEDVNADGYTIEFVPVGQSTEDWIHLLTFHGTPVTRKPHRVSLRFRVDKEEKIMRARCRNKTWWTVIWVKEDRVIYSWRTHKCPGQDDQAGIAAYITGESTLFRVAYTKKTQKMMTPKDKHWWERVLLDAEVEQTHSE